MLVFDGLRLCFFLFQRGRKGLRRGLNYKCIMLLLRFLTVELHKKSRKIYFSKAKTTKNL